LRRRGLGWAVVNAESMTSASLWSQLSALELHPAFLPVGGTLTVALLCLVFFGAVRHYSDPCDRHPLATLVTVLSLTATLLVVLMVPLDVFAVSTGELELGAVKLRLEALERLYDRLHMLLLSFAFGAVPFAYFYVEEDDSDVDGERSRLSKALGALRCTLVVVAALGLLLVAGLLVRPSAPPTPSSIDSAWMRQLLDVEHGGLSVLNFAVAVLAALGALVWLVYTAHGLVMLPASLCAPAAPRRHRVRGVDYGRFDDDDDDDDDDASEWELTRTRQRQQEIGHRYAASGGRMSRTDLGALDKLQQRADAVTRARDDARPGLARRACGLSLRACRLLLGTLTGLGSALLLGSLLFVSADRAMHSTCGARCGFMLPDGAQPLFNPLDYVFVQLSAVFPLDLVALAALVLFLFWTSLFAIGSIGVRIACVLLYRVSPAATSPQALLLVAVLMQLVGFMLCLQLPALLPQYATFGAQTVAADDGSRRPCSLHSVAATDGRCHSTYMVRMAHRVYSGIPGLAALFQLVHWAFVLACALWAVRVAYARRCSGRRRPRRHDDDDDEAQGLLDN